MTTNQQNRADIKSDITNIVLTVIVQFPVVKNSRKMLIIDICLIILQMFTQCAEFLQKCAHFSLDIDQLVSNLFKAQEPINERKIPFVFISTCSTYRAIL